MSFRRSPETISRINDALRRRYLSGERIEVNFRSDPDVIAGVLPPPLKPGGSDRVTARVTRWVSNYCGAFTMAGLYIDAEHEGVCGEYILSMFIDSFDPALLIGREGLGEPKKMADVQLFRKGNSFLGTVDRYGTRLMTLRVDGGDDRGPSSGSGVIFSVKATLAPGEGGLQDDAILFGQEIDVDVSESRLGPGALSLNGTAHDPLDEFPVLEVLESSYAVCGLGNPRAAAGGDYIRARIPKDVFLPYHYGRLDDWSALNPLAAFEHESL